MNIFFIWGMCTRPDSTKMNLFLKGEWHEKPQRIPISLSVHWEYLKSGKQENAPSQNAADGER